MDVVKLALSAALLGLLGLVLYAEHVPPVGFRPDVDREMVLEGKLIFFKGHDSSTQLAVSYQAVQKAVVFSAVQELELNQTLRLTGVMDDGILQVYRVEILK
jgi:hypothetical protein